MRLFVNKESSNRPEHVNVDEAYKMIIVNLSRKRQGKAFSNPDGSHAEYALTEIFRTANKEVFIFAHSLNTLDGSKRSKEYLGSIHGFLTRNMDTRLNVIVEKESDDSETLNFMRALRRRFGDKVSLKKLTNGFDKYIKTVDDESFHFTIADERIVRFEYDTANRRASLNFNDEDFYTKLKNCFEHYSKSSVDIESSEVSEIVENSILELKEEFYI